MAIRKEVWYNRKDDRNKEGLDMIGLRRFCRADAKTVQDCLYPEMQIGEIEDMIADWNRGAFRGRYFELFAVTADGRIAGTASLSERSRSVVSFGIEIFERERKKGIASETMRLLLRYAAEKGYRAVLDQVGTDNEASIRLHESSGFESDGYVYRNRRDREVLLYLRLTDETVFDKPPKI